MVKLDMPSTVHGDWIGLKSLQYRDDSVMFARHEFTVDMLGRSATLWISADSAYALYLNEQFVGCGPRMQPDPDAAGVDVYDVEFFLHPGNNVLSVIIYAGSRQGEGVRRSDAGFWCQLDSENETLVHTDRFWRVAECPAMIAARSRQAGGTLMRMEYVDFRGIPVDWMAVGYAFDMLSWRKPDFVMPPHDARIELRIDPFRPASPEVPVSFNPMAKGNLSICPKETHALFSSIFKKSHIRPASYAAMAFLYSEEPCTLTMSFITDDPFRLFCNETLVRRGSADDGTVLIECSLRDGWNRLLVVQEPHESSAGFMMLFPDEKDDEFRIYQDTLADAPRCWNLVGPLRLPLAEATASISFERLPVTSFVPSLENMAHISDYLAACRVEINSEEENLVLHPGECALFRLDTLRYGFPHLILQGGEGTIVDVSSGYFLNEWGIPVRAGHRRSTDTICCSGHEDEFSKFYPLECYYLMVSVRSGDVVTLFDCTFEEMVRFERDESHFECSDELLNRIWHVGARTIRRAAARLRHADLHMVSDCYLLDAFIHAENMVSVCGDLDYSMIRLRQFANAQFENGDIPAFCFDRRHIPQLQHLFFYPNWMLFNYRIGADGDELIHHVSSLDLLLGYLESLLDQDSGLLSNIGRKVNIHAFNPLYQYDHEDVPTTLNALFCRFLLSSAEVYRRVGRDDTAVQCIRRASLLAAALKKSNFDLDKGIYRMNSRGNASDGYEMNANFMALQSGVLSMEEFERFFFRYFNYAPPFHRCPDVGENHYFLFLFLEMLFAVGQGEWAVQCLKHHWGSRIHEELQAWCRTPESKDEVLPAGLSGGNAISPNFFLVREVAGVRLAEGEDAAIFFSPTLSAVEWVHFVMPTRWGRIKVEWRHVPESGGLEVTIEAAFPLKVVPQFSRETLKNTTFNLSDRVTLLDPGDE